MFRNKNGKNGTVPTILFQICILSMSVDASTQPARFVAFVSHTFQTVPLLTIMLLHHNKQALAQNVFILSRSALVLDKKCTTSLEENRARQLQGKAFVQ